MAEMTKAELENSSVEQSAVFGKAMKVYTDRNRKYQDLWKHEGAQDQILHIRSKFLRVRHGIRSRASADEVVEDALDLINYAAMVVRNVQAGNYGEINDQIMVPVSVLSRLLDEEDCMLDHDGFCQEHSYEPPCPHGRMRKIMAED